MCLSLHARTMARKIFPGTVFVSTDLPEKRVRVTKSKQELDDFDDDSTDIFNPILLNATV